MRGHFHLDMVAVQYHVIAIRFSMLVPNSTNLTAVLDYISKKDRLLIVHDIID